MKYILKGAFFTTVIMVLILFLSSPLFAHTVWVNGVVTKRPWTGKYQYIEVNNIRYTLMPKIVKITAPRKTGALSKKQIINGIKKGQKIWIRVQGHRIYEITISPNSEVISKRVLREGCK